MRFVLIALLMMLGSVTSSFAEVHVSIGINLPVYPRLVRVPGYPVYYAPQVNSNYFFYDGLYWVLVDDNWYSSPWYNGPWRVVDPYAVPLYVLRVPVRYYRHPPVYFRGWRADAPPRWGDHWGHAWEQRRSGWNTWDRKSAQAPAPLPTYQRQYFGSRYPQVEQQSTLHTENYRYQPKDALVQQNYQQHYLQQSVQVAPAPRAQGEERGQQGRGGPKEQHEGKGQGREKGRDRQER